MGVNVWQINKHTYDYECNLNITANGQYVHKWQSRGFIHCMVSGSQALWLNL